MPRVASLVVGIGLVLGFVFVGFHAAPGQTAKSTEKSAGKRLALVVGVNRYKHAKLDPLEFAERDAEELAKLLGGQGYRVVLMTAAEGQRDPKRLPTRQNIDLQVKELLKDVGRDDLIVVGLAGHGIQPDGSAECFYCPQDANPTIEPGKGGEPAAPETLVRITGNQSGVEPPQSKGLIQTLDDSGIGRKLIFIDACRNDTSTGRGRGLGSNIVALPSSTYVMLSCAARERSFETKKLGGGHGAFFHFVLEGLRGAAKNDAGVVTWNRLAEYVYDNVSIKVPEVMGGGAEQHPNEKKNGDPSVALLTVKVPPRPRPNFASAPFNAATAKKLQDDWASFIGQPVQLTNSINMKFQLIPPGTFQMGSPTGEAERSADEGPQHAVTIAQPFYLGTFEVTQGEYERLMETNPSWFARTGDGKDKVAGQDTSRFPVEKVSWEDAVAFCDRLNNSSAEKQAGRRYRLPTEAEWEYACRAGTVTPFHYGSASDATKANFDGNLAYGGGAKGTYLQRTTTAGSYPSNAFGLSDMHGNVWEWCQDPWHANYDGAPTDGSAWEAGGNATLRVLRGGSWYFYPGFARCAYRVRGSPVGRCSSVGFRVVCVIGVRTP